MTVANRAGFTLIEVLLSVVIISVLVGVSLPVYETYARRNDLEVTTQGVVAMLRRAATYARGVNDDSAWTVQIVGNSVVLFQGTTYATRDTTLDETLQIPGSMTASGLTEVQFTKVSALPNTTGSITLTSSTNDIRTITINAKGVVGY